MPAPTIYLWYHERISIALPEFVLVLRYRVHGWPTHWIVRPSGVLGAIAAMAALTITAVVAVLFVTKYLQNVLAHWRSLMSNFAVARASLLNYHTIHVLWFSLALKYLTSSFDVRFRLCCCDFDVELALLNWLCRELGFLDVVLPADGSVVNHSNSILFVHSRCNERNGQETGWNHHVVSYWVL